MITEQVVIKSKKQDLEGSPFDYEAPSNLEEALEKDGEEKVYKLYAQIRKIRWMDSKRKELNGGGIPSQIKKLIEDKNLSEEDIMQLGTLLGLDLTGG